jgi:threonine-phosphate decarboxylase
LLADLAASGVEVLGADANYVFFRSAVPVLDQKLMREGILIRNCGNFRGLESGHYRVGVRLEEENDALIRAIGAVADG